MNDKPNQWFNKNQNGANRIACQMVGRSCYLTVEEFTLICIVWWWTRAHFPVIIVYSSCQPLRLQATTFNIVFECSISAVLLYEVVIDFQPPCKTIKSFSCRTVFKWLNFMQVCSLDMWLLMYSSYTWLFTILTKFTLNLMRL